MCSAWQSPPRVFIYVGHLSNIILYIASSLSKQESSDVAEEHDNFSLFCGHSQQIRNLMVYVVCTSVSVVDGRGINLSIVAYDYNMALLDIENKLERRDYRLSSKSGLDYRYPWDSIVSGTA